MPSNHLQFTENRPSPMISNQIYPSINVVGCLSSENSEMLFGDASDVDFSRSFSSAAKSLQLVLRKSPSALDPFFGT
jgi:hypothetical protein